MSSPDGGPRLSDSETVTRDDGSNESAIDAVVAAFTAFCDFAVANENLYRFLRIATTAENRDTALDRITGTTIAELVAVHLKSRGLNPAMGEVWGRGMFAMALGMAEWWLATGTLPRETLVDHFRSFLELGLGPTSPVTDNPTNPGV